MDLNNLIPGNSGWELLEARAINDSSQIAGHGFHNGEFKAFLLTPARSIQVSFHRLTPDAVQNLSGVTVDDPIVPKSSWGALLQQPPVTSGLVADGVTPLLVQIQLSNRPTAPTDFKIRVVSISGNHLPSEIASKLRLLHGTSFIPSDASHDQVTILPSDDPPVAFSYVRALDSDFVFPPLDSPEVTVELGVQKADATEPEETVSFKIRKPPVLLVHGYNTTGEWGEDFKNILQQDRPADFVKTIHFGLHTTPSGIMYNTHWKFPLAAFALSTELTAC